jgi:hypothetical protein
MHLLKDPMAAAKKSSIARPTSIAATKKTASEAAGRKQSRAPEILRESASRSTEPKLKLVRDSFTIPKVEYVVLESLKMRAAKLGRPSKKSEVLRAGVRALSLMSDKALLSALSAVPSLKTGRPKGEATDLDAK